MLAFDPFRNFEMVRREVDRAFEDLLNITTGRRTFAHGTFAAAYPLANVGQDAERVVVEMLVPGADPDKLDVRVLHDQLAVSGEVPAWEPAEDESLHRRERFAGKFFRTIALPSEVDPDKVTAEYRNGVLRLTAEKAETARPRRIQITAA